MSTGLMNDAVKVRVGPQHWHLHLTDFNRLRWTIAALRMGGAARFAGHLRPSAAQLLFDSTRVLAAPSHTPVPLGAFIVLWDGLNSLIELQHARPDLRARSDLHYLYVGFLEDLRVAFPTGSQPLLPEHAPAEAELRRVHAPAWVAGRAHLQAALRPLKNSKQAPASHRSLRAGYKLVFCGLVRPTAAVLDGFFRGSEMPGLRAALAPLEGLDWRLAASQHALVAAYEALRAARPCGASDLAAAYSVASVLHRMGTLAVLHEQGAPLFVNEFGLQPHFDPYDAWAYGQHLFIDFGSTRGCDALYPRTLDLLAQHKRYAALRWVQPGQRMVARLADVDANAFIALCETHASQLLVQHRRAEHQPAGAAAADGALR